MPRIARRRPKRSASIDRGRVSTPTVRATMLLSVPSWVSVSAHWALRNGKTAASTCRHMKSDSSSANDRPSTSHGKSPRPGFGSAGSLVSGASTGSRSTTLADLDRHRAVDRGDGAGSGAPLAGTGAEVLAEPRGEGAGSSEAEQAADLGERVPLVGQLMRGEPGAGRLHDRREALPLGGQTPVQGARLHAQLVADVDHRAAAERQEELHQRADFISDGLGPWGRK